MTLEILQIVALFAIAAALWLRKPIPGPPGPKGDQGEKGEPGAVHIPGVRHDLAKRYRRHGSGPQLDGEVEIGSAAYQLALDTPGFGVQHRGEEINWGKQ